MVQTEASELANILKLFDLSIRDGQMILIVLPVFVLLWRLLDKVFFYPYWQLAETRESQTIGAQETAALNREREKALLQQYENALLAERIKAVEGKLKRITEAKAEAARIIDVAEKQAQAELKKVRADIAADLARTEGETTREAQALAELIKQRIQSGQGVSAIQ